MSSAQEYIARRERLGIKYRHPRITKALKTRDVLDVRKADEYRDAEDSFFDKPLTPLPTWKSIVMEVCKKHKITLTELKSDSRAAKYVRARDEATWRLRKETTLSLPAIGKRLNRDHTSIRHCILRYEELLNGRD